jgi:hypothetical protein
MLLPTGAEVMLGSPLCARSIRARSARDAEDSGPTPDRTPGAV